MVRMKGRVFRPALSHQDVKIVVETLNWALKAGEEMFTGEIFEAAFDLRSRLRDMVKGK